MASTHARELLAVTAISATTTTEPVELLSGDVNFIGRILVTDESSASYAAEIQHSHDKVNWETLLDFTAISGNVHEIIQVDNTSVHVMGFVRVLLTRSAGSANISIDLLHDRRK